MGVVVARVAAWAKEMATMVPAAWAVDEAVVGMEGTGLAAVAEASWAYGKP